MEEFDVDEMQGLAFLLYFHTCTPVIRKNLLTRVSLLFKESNLESLEGDCKEGWGYKGYKGMSELKGVLIEGMHITLCLVAISIYPVECFK